MDILQNAPYIVLAVIAIIFVRRWLMFRAVRQNLPKYLEEGAIIIDVRSEAEFSGGNAKGSINIPLQEIQHRARKLDANKTILLCCASGNRSGMAAMMLKGMGFKNVVNAGPWVNVA
jgi:rhodanese-related sulfurtransferase